jgi:hypothetical protein
MLLTNIVLAIATIHYHPTHPTLGGGTLVIVATLVGYALNENVMLWTTGGLKPAYAFLLLLSHYELLENHS